MLTPIKYLIYIKFSLLESHTSFLQFKKNLNLSIKKPKASVIGSRPLIVSKNKKASSPDSIDLYL
jgi:hypothetical protein